MSDLQCAATLLLCGAGESDPDGLTLAGRRQARALGESLGAAGVAMVYSSSLPAAVQTAELAAAPGGRRVRVREGLGGDGSDAGVRDRIREELESIVDQHRGETVLVVGDSRAVRCVVPPLARNLPLDVPEPAPCAVCEVAVDADGWLARSWSGETV